MEAITREEMLLSGKPLEPITRKELFLAKAAGMDVQTPEPITREEMFLSMIQGGSGGGSDPVIEPLSVTENGTYEAPDGVDGYSPVTVNVASGGGDEWEEQFIAAIERDSSKPVTKLPDGVTKIGGHAFYANSYVVTLTIPDSVKTIEHHAFYSCSRLELSELPDSITEIADNAFYNCVQLPLTVLPTNLVTIAGTAFRYCKKLAIKKIPSGVVTIGSQAFADCDGLTEITFEGTPTNINSLAFRNDTNILTINVPWAEGEVANAPWGATNATINYNYTGG